jgi:hypothetical protein
MPEEFVPENPEIPYIDTRVAGGVAEQVTSETERERPCQH